MDLLFLETFWTRTKIDLLAILCMWCKICFSGEFAILLKDNLFFVEGIFLTSNIIIFPKFWGEKLYPSLIPSILITLTCGMQLLMTLKLVTFSVANENGDQKFYFMLVIHYLIIIILKIYLIIQWLCQWCKIII